MIISWSGLNCLDDINGTWDRAFFRRHFLSRLNRRSRLIEDVVKGARRIFGRDRLMCCLLRHTLRRFLIHTLRRFMSRSLRRLLSHILRRLLRHTLRRLRSPDDLVHGESRVFGRHRRSTQKASVTTSAEVLHLRPGQNVLEIKNYFLLLTFCNFVKIGVDSGSEVCWIGNLKG